MADNIYDLRKYNIKDMKDAMQFLELVEARIPQIVKVVRKQSLVEASLKNRISIAENRPQPAAVIEDTRVDKNITALAQLTGKNAASVKPDASRLAQMKAAAQTGADQEKKDQIKAAAAQVRVGKLPTPVAPGEIGQLNIDGPNESATLVTPEQDNVVSAVNLPQVGFEGDSSGAVTVGEGNAAAGSKSELAVDQNVQQEVEVADDPVTSAPLNDAQKIDPNNPLPEEPKTKKKKKTSK